MLTRLSPSQHRTFLGTLAILALGVIFSTTAIAQDPERVTMKLDEFLRLYEKTMNRPDKPENAPHQAALASAHYQGEVVVKDDEPVSAKFSAKMRVDVLKDKGWIRIPLLPATVAIQNARMGGSPAPLVLEHGWYFLVTDKKGTLDLTIDFAASVTTGEGQSALAFELARSGATTMELSVPATDALDFNVSGARLTTDRVQGDRRIVSATLPATGSLAVSWNRAIPETEKEKPRVYAETFHLVGLGDGLLQTTATVAYTILQAPVETLTARIPADATLVDVQGAGVREWNLGDDGVVTVQLNYAAEGAYRLTLFLERPLPEGGTAMDAPLVNPTGVDRTKGWVGVEARGNLEIAAGEGARAVVPVDVRTLPPAILGLTNQPVLLGYKYIGEDAHLPLVIAQHEDIDVLVTLLDQAQITTLFTREGRRLTQIVYQARNNRKQFLRLEMPEGAVIWSAMVAGKAVQPARSSDGRILIPLVRSNTSAGSLSSFDIQLVYVEDGQPTKPGNATFKASLPKVDVPTTYVGWTVYAPYEVKIKRKSGDGTLRKVDWLSQPYFADDIYAAQNVMYDEAADVMQQATAFGNSGGLDRGAAPVQVSVPLDGQAVFFEKLLALDEDLWVSFDYKAPNK